MTIDMKPTFNQQLANLQSIRVQLSKAAAAWESERVFYKRKMQDQYPYAEPVTSRGREAFDNLNYYRDHYRFCCKMTERYAKNIKAVKKLIADKVLMFRDQRFFSYVEEN